MVSTVLVVIEIDTKVVAVVMGAVEVEFVTVLVVRVGVRVVVDWVSVADVDVGNDEVVTIVLVEL